MGVPTSEVGYTTATPRWEDHRFHKDMWWHWIKEREGNNKSVTLQNRTHICVTILNEKNLKDNIVNLRHKAKNLIFK
jgi:hypothetical protein